MCLRWYSIKLFTVEVVYHYWTHIAVINWHYFHWNATRNGALLQNVCVIFWWNLLNPYDGFARYFMSNCPGRLKLKLGLWRMYPTGQEVEMRRYNIWRTPLYQIHFDVNIECLWIAVNLYEPSSFNMKKWNFIYYLGYLISIRYWPVSSSTLLIPVFP